MKEVNLNFPILGLDGKEIPEANAGKLLAETLSSHNEGDALKFFGWARKLYVGEALSLDASDLGKLKEFVQNSKFLPNITKAQILEAIA